MAFGEPTSKQAITGYGYQFFMESIDADHPAASVADDANFVEVEGMKSGALPSPDRPEIDCTTTMDKVKAYLPGIGSINDISLEFNFYPENKVHQDIIQNVLYNDTPRFWKITGHGMTFIFLGYLKSANTSFGVDAVTSMPLVLKVTSDPQVTWPTDTPVVPPTTDPNPAPGGGEESGGDNTDPGTGGTPETGGDDVQGGGGTEDGTRINGVPKTPTRANS